jgi:gamma-glutamylcyclotransferase (GGCT)/AIG2-like uncharacterized protein YtfP
VATGIVILNDHTMELLFSYGTLQKENVQRQLFGRSLKGSGDILQGYQRSTIAITDENFLLKGEDSKQQTLVRTDNSNDSIEGTVFEITGEELLLADQYEPVNYKRTKVKLHSGKEAWVYLV